MTSKPPPIVSPASRARSISAIICALDVGVDAVQRRVVGAAPRACSKRDRQRIGQRDADRWTKTWLTMLDARRARAAAGRWRRRRRARRSRARWRARARRACRRGRTSRRRPGRRGPGRGRVTGGAVARRRASAGGSPASTCIVRCQFSQSLFGISSAIGPPVVTPWRTPESTRRDRIRSPCGGRGRSRPGAGASRA